MSTTCPHCYGTGQDVPYDDQRACRECGGQGYVEDDCDPEDWTDFEANCAHKCKTPHRHCDILCGKRCATEECRLPLDTSTFCREETCPVYRHNEEDYA